MKDGAIVGDGERSHLFWMTEQCENCAFKAKVRLNHGGNSGDVLSGRVRSGLAQGLRGPGGQHAFRPKAYSGSLYNFANVTEQLVPDDTWWDQEIIADGNHIIIKVNGKTTVDYVDEKNTYTKGYLALQQHNKGSVVEYKDLMFKRLPAH